MIYLPTTVNHVKLARIATLKADNPGMSAKVIVDKVAKEFAR